jgi:hypothetical protein
MWYVLSYIAAVYLVFVTLIVAAAFIVARAVSALVGVL